MSTISVCRELPEKAEDRLIVALDVPTISEARAVIDKLEGVASFFKLGLWLQFAAGFDGLIDYLLAKNKNIFPVLTWSGLPWQNCRFRCLWAT
jgi:orotidine-5'-phosphate decarboxylase